MNADTFKTMKMPRRAPAPTPTYQQICDLALALAKQGGVVEKPLLNLIHRPHFAPPPPQPECFFMGWAERLRDQAKAILTEQMAALPRPRIRRRRRIRKKPNLTRFWTRRPLKHAHPPPRRRNFLLPSLLTYAPPGRDAEKAPAQCPCRHAPERLIFYTALFDNQIAV